MTDTLELTWKTGVTQEMMGNPEAQMLISIIYYNIYGTHLNTQSVSVYQSDHGPLTPLVSDAAVEATWILNGNASLADDNHHPDPCRGSHRLSALHLAIDMIYCHLHLAMNVQDVLGRYRVVGLRVHRLLRNSHLIEDNLQASQLRSYVLGITSPFFICGPPQRKQPELGFEGIPPGFARALTPPKPPLPAVVSWSTRCVYFVRPRFPKFLTCITSGNMVTSIVDSVASVKSCLFRISSSCAV